MRRRCDWGGDGKMVVQLGFPLSPPEQCSGSCRRVSGGFHLLLWTRRLCISPVTRLERCFTEILHTRRLNRMAHECRPLVTNFLRSPDTWVRPTSDALTLPEKRGGNSVHTIFKADWTPAHIWLPRHAVGMG